MILSLTKRSTMLRVRAALKLESGFVDLLIRGESAKMTLSSSVLRVHGSMRPILAIIILLPELAKLFIVRFTTGEGDDCLSRNRCTSSSMLVSVSNDVGTGKSTPSRIFRARPSCPSVSITFISLRLMRFCSRVITGFLRDGEGEGESEAL